MGESLNSEIIENCVILAQECLKEEEFTACRAFLQTVELGVHVFPDICCTDETNTTLAELLSDCRSVPREYCKVLNENNIVTLLSSILSHTTSSIPDGEQVSRSFHDSTPFLNCLFQVSFEKNDLKKQLTNLCTSDGTPDQAFNAVYSLSKLLNPDGSWAQTSCSNFSSLFQCLTSTSRLRLEVGSEDSSLVTILSSLSALAECCPLSFLSDRGDRAMKFALDSALLGRNQDGEDSEADENHSVATPSPKKERKSVSSTRKASTPEKTGVLEDPCLSSSCRRLCASIQFLVTLVRFSCFANEVNKKISPADRFEVQPDIISSLFQTLAQIIIDQGLPPSSKDRDSCKSRRDRAALRQVSVISLLRLCDARVGLERDYLTLTMWHLLGGAFLDEESSVRESILGEYSDMLSGSGAYGSSSSRLPPTAPSLRFLALICFTGDGDHDHDPANGCAANIGALVSTVQDSATRSINGFRRASESYYARCKALGSESVHRFESGLKMKLMPENAIPYAYHLLTHRRETPSQSADNVNVQSDDSDDDVSVGATGSDHKSRTLQRRLRLLLDPLVHSLGDHADNISYLIRMTETLGKLYRPIDVSLQYAGAPQPKRFSLRSPMGQNDDMKGRGRRERTALLHERLSNICVLARDILIAYIKQDVNITPYPGQISFPNGLFQQAASGVVVVGKSLGSGTSEQQRRKRSKPRAAANIAASFESEDEIPKHDNLKRAGKSPGVAFSSGDSKKPKMSTPSNDPYPSDNEEKMPSSAAVSSSGRSSRVHFSPEITRGPMSAKKSLSVSPKGSVHSLTSPATFGTATSIAVATLGATPPSSSIVPTSTALDESDDEDIPGGKSTSQSIATLSTGDSHSTRSSRRRKEPERFLPTTEEVRRKPKKQKKTPPPKQIHLKKASRGSLGSTSISKDTKKKNDSADLDFPSGVENRPKSRSNRGGRKRSAKA